MPQPIPFHGRTRVALPHNRVHGLQAADTPITGESVKIMGRESRRKLKTVDEHITQTPELPARLKFLLRHPWIGVLVFVTMSPVEIIVGAWNGARLAQKQSADVIGVFLNLATGRNAE